MTKEGLAFSIQGLWFKFGIREQGAGSTLKQKAKGVRAGVGGFRVQGSGFRV